MNLPKEKYVSIPEAQAVCEKTIPKMDDIARFELVSFMLGFHIAFEVEERKAEQEELNLEPLPEESENQG